MAWLPGLFPETDSLTSTEPRPAGLLVGSCGQEAGFPGRATQAVRQNSVSVHRLASGHSHTVSSLTNWKPFPRVEKRPPGRQQEPKRSFQEQLLTCFWALGTPDQGTAEECLSCPLELPGERWCSPRHCLRVRLLRDLLRGPRPGTRGSGHTSTETAAAAPSPRASGASPRAWLPRGSVPVAGGCGPCGQP